MSEPLAPSERVIRHVYLDPLDAIWLSCARRLGLRLRRSGDAYASSDGRGELTIGTAETLDPDDCLAQMIFHEICHWIVQGRESIDAPDWRLQNREPPELLPEHACLRIQAHLAGAHGLGAVLAPTTDFREFYDTIAAAPWSPDGDPSVELARVALERASAPPWAPHLERALVATQRIVAIVAASWSDDPASELTCLYTLYDGT